MSGVYVPQTVHLYQHRDIAQQNPSEYNLVT
jgi:hypothetical protein